MKCFDCNGEGGETNVILDDGTGPWEGCGVCNGTGELNIIKYLWLRFMWWKWGAETYKQRKTRKFHKWASANQR